jgi:hypothetical protein
MHNPFVKSVADLEVFFGLRRSFLFGIKMIIKGNVFFEIFKHKTEKGSVFLILKNIKEIVYFLIFKIMGYAAA